MKRLAAFALAASVGILSAQPVLSQETPLPTQLGFVNMRVVFDKYWKRAKIEEGLRARTDALETAIGQQKVRIEEMGDELATLNRDSDEYRAMSRDLELLRFTIKLDQEQELRRIQREAERKEKLLYKDVVRECQAFGESRGYAAILLTAPLGPDFEEKADLDIVVATRTVLWQDDRLDVTEQVLEFLNADQPR